MKNCLIITYGYFGDIFFQSSIAKKLKEEKQFDEVYYLIGFPQIYRLISNNPYIDKVFLTNSPNPFPKADENLINECNTVIEMKQFSFIDPPPLECKLWAGIKNPDTYFEIYTEPEYDVIAKQEIDKIRNKNNKKVIAIPADWEDRTFLFTEEEYKEGKDPKNIKGYGGKRRNVNEIKEELSKYFNILNVGLPLEVKQHQTIGVPENDSRSILFECSMLKSCDAFIGSEGGMCNMASGVGTRTITTGDFVHQLYGWNGSVRKIKNPKLGPVYYFPDKEHVELNPFLTDEEVSTKIKELML